MSDPVRNLFAAAAVVVVAGIALWRRRPIRPPDAPGSWEPASASDGTPA